MEQCSNITYPWHFFVLRSITKIPQSTIFYDSPEIIIILSRALCIKKMGL